MTIRGMVLNGVVAATCMLPLASAPAAAATYKDIVASKSIAVGYTTSRPWSFMDQKGEIKGVEPDIIRAILGDVKIDAVAVEFNGLIPGLQAGRFDASNGGIYITPERCKLVIFSNPYLRVGDTLMVAAGNSQKLHSYKDIAANDAVRIGALRGSINSKNMEAAGIPSSRQILLPDAPALLSALKSGRVDAASLSQGVASALLLAPGAKDGVELAAPFTGYVKPGGTESVGYAAFAFRKDQQELADAFNKGLAEIARNGKLAAVLNDYNFGERSLPGDASTEQLCKN